MTDAPAKPRTPRYPPYGVRPKDNPYAALRRHMRTVKDVAIHEPYPGRTNTDMPWPTQHVMMRYFALLTQYDREKSIAFYAAAEADGHVRRRKNANRLTPIRYATILWDDGVRRGWLDPDYVPGKRGPKPGSGGRPRKHQPDLKDPRS